MIVNFALPEVSVPASAISEYWLRYFFVGSPSQSFQVNALASTYMRLVEASITEYQLGSKALREVWENHTSLGLSAMHRSIAHFENCISGMHRAIAAYRRLRSHPTRDPVSVYLADVKPTFIANKIAFQVRNMRDAVHHMEEKLIKGEVEEGQPIALKPDGTEAPHPTEAGQIIKTIDHLVIGPYVLRFIEIAEWLTEMSTVAAKVAQFDPRQQTLRP